LGVEVEVTRLSEGSNVSYGSTSADLTGLSSEPTSGAYTMPAHGTLNISCCYSAAADLYIRTGSTNQKVMSLLADTFNTIVISLPSGRAFSIRFSATGTVRELCVDAISKGSF
jgi:hypothetical protein